jgi:flagellar biosynthesis protein FliR
MASDVLSTWVMTHAGVAALAFSRSAGLAWSAPALATPGMGVRFRVVLAALLALILVPVVRGGPALPEGWGAVAAACAGEVAVGAALGWSAALVVAGARQAGELVGAQAGLSAAALFDPEAGEELSALGHLYGLIALGVFLALDGPLALVRALVESYRVVPPGGEVLTAAGVSLAFGKVGEALALSLRASAPVALALALAGLALGLLGRAAPSLQLVALALPVRAALGLAAVMAGLVTLAATFAAAWGGWPGPFGGF